MRVRTGKIILAIMAGVVAVIIAASVSLQFNTLRGIEPVAALGAVQQAGALSASGGELNIEESKRAGISIMSAKIEPEAYAENGIESQAVSAYTLTATVYPEDATDKSLDWTLVWNQTARDKWGNLMYSADSWYTHYTEDDSYDLSTYELADYGITEYDFLNIKPNIDGGNILTITCIKEFGCPINITCTARDGSGVSATCKVDLAVKATNVYIPSQSVTPLESGRDTSVSYSIGQSLGTAEPETTREVTVSVKIGTDWSTILMDNGISTSLPYGYGWQSDNYFSDYDYKEITGSVLFIYNTTWDTLCDTFIVQQSPQLTENQKRANRDAARQALQELSNKGLLKTVPLFSVEVNVTDSYTGKTFTASRNFYIDNVSKIPVYNVSVSNITLPDSIIL